MTCSSVPGARHSTICRVVSPRNDPISTIRVAPTASMTGAIARSQNGNIDRRRSAQTITGTYCPGYSDGAKNHVSMAWRSFVISSSIAVRCRKSSSKIRASPGSNTGR